ncbi:MAG: hypothetical protein E7257_01655 [Lachnospiraceae bacterium]|nr:hypothetical protein [Lachnospiraceae bacterium]
MQIILIALIIIFLIASPFFRFLPMQLHNLVYYLPVDVYRYIKYKKSNECPYFGFIKVFCGYFGSGKSLSAVNEVINIYKKYNGLVVWDKDLQAFIRQKITIISNLDLKGVPYIEWTSEQQFINYQTVPGEIVLFLVDEIGTVWNNRDFKNFNPDVFQNIVQSRKRKMAIFGTLPDFLGTDINVRRYTHSVVQCDKNWRFIKHRYYNPRDIENCNNLDLIMPTQIKYLFVKDRQYNQYDTYKMIEKLTNDMLEGNMLTYNELNEASSGDIRQARLKRKYKKRQSS